MRAPPRVFVCWAIAAAACCKVSVCERRSQPRSTIITLQVQEEQGWLRMLLVPFLQTQTPMRTVRISIRSGLTLDAWPVKDLMDACVRERGGLKGMRLWSDGLDQAAVNQTRPEWRTKTLSKVEAEVLRWSSNMYDEKPPIVSVRMDANADTPSFSGLFITLRGSHLRERVPIFRFHPYMSIGTIIQGQELFTNDNHSHTQTRRRPLGKVLSVKVRRFQDEAL